MKEGAFPYESLLESPGILELQHQEEIIKLAFGVTAVFLAVCICMYMYAYVSYVRCNVFTFRTMLIVQHQFLAPGNRAIKFSHAARTTLLYTATTLPTRLLQLEPQDVFNMRMNRAKHQCASRPTSADLSSKIIHNARCGLIVDNKTIEAPFPDSKNI